MLFAVSLNFSFAQLRYASSVIGFSSQYNTGVWSANQALGAPDVYPNYGDLAGAWASSTTSSQREYLELDFGGTPTPIDSIGIWETYVPGAVDTVYVKNPTTNSWEIVYTATAAAAGNSSRILRIGFPMTAFNVTQIRIAINSPAVPGWNEIDAVAISRYTPLPVELTHFTAQEQQKTTLLTWATASERNNAYFVIERSDDAINWEEVAKVEGAGNNTTTLHYSTTDYTPLKGKSYYRLVQYDFDGTSSPSHIEAVYFAEEKVISLFPNPTLEAKINLQLDGFKNQKATVSINDISGATHFSQEIMLYSNSEKVNLSTNLAKGVYLVVVKSKGASYTERLIVK